MKKTYFLLFLLTLFVGTVSVYGDTIYVPGNYSTIQGAIDAATSGDVIIVGDNIYYERLVVNKSITLKSENGPENCIINGGNSGGVINIRSNGVIIEGFTIRNSGYQRVGIEVYSNNNTIKNNKILNNWYGIYLHSSSNNNSIIGNNISNNGGDGIYLIYSSNNSINDNNITSNNWRGIHSRYSSNNSINDNNITSNNWGGIYLLSSNSNTIKDNTFIDNGILIEEGGLEYWTHTIENNTINGKPLYYFRNKVGGNISDAGQVILVNCSDMIVENLKINNTDVGITIAYSSNITVKNNVLLSNNDYGIYLSGSSNNSIINNSILNNGDDGIRLWSSSNNNIIDNSILNNGDYGIHLRRSSSNNNIIDNSISNNMYGGIRLWYSSNNNIINDNAITSNSGDGIYLDISVSNFINDNSITSNSGDGIYLDISGNNIINDNSITSNNDGIYLYDSKNNSIADNNISNNGDDGIHLLDSRNNNIISNNISNNGDDGISIVRLKNNNIIDNNISNNGDDGINLWYSSSNTIKDNTFIDDGILIGGDRLEYWTHTIENNTINGKPLCYFKNKVGGNVSENAGQVILVNCSDMIVENLKISNISMGIDIAYSSNIAVKNNVLSNNRDDGIRLWSSSNSSIIGNNISNNKRDGIYLSSSSNNSIIDNNISNNGDDGIYLIYSSNNRIYLNNFNNSQNARSYNSRNNTWNSPEEIIYIYNGTQYTNYLGNYWDNYNGNDTDGDGIGDTPYQIDGNNIDHYPLILEELKPNLKIKNIITNTPIYNGIQTEINLTIINNGNENINTTFPVEITIKNASGDVVYTNVANINGLNAVAMKNITFNWTPNNTGTYRIIAFVDPNNIINESNESDNTITLSNVLVESVPGPITKPNLLIENIITNTPIYTGTQTEINISIINNGNENITTTFPVNLTIKNASGDVVYTNMANINGLNISENKIVTFNWTPNNTGNYSITAFVDSNNIINESNENDNNYTLSNVEIYEFENVFPTLNNNSKTITLKKGWNVLSIPHRANITFSNPEAVESIITYYNDDWDNITNLNEIKPLYGYYIYCNSSTYMNIKYITSEEPTAPPARPVFKGWNLVGVNPGQYDIDGVILIDFVLPVEDSWIMILDPENNNLYTKNDYISSILLHSYDAYWMYNKENDILPGRNLN
ncbi:right-handed parallel beta-helix repeat-containing protein [Methanothermococcus sp. SCGC AD-155-M21]|nr:right-handed parallel beta-helix repeat-containing protein [Methanothermococcus sp. SCGC AD-155-M21]